MDVTPLPPTTPGDQPPAFQLPRERLEAAPEVHRQPPASPAPRQHDAAIPATIHLGAALIHTYLRFTVADDGRIQARIVNSDTNEVVREIPAEEVIYINELLRKYQEHAQRQRAAEPRQPAPPDE